MGAVKLPLMIAPTTTMAMPSSALLIQSLVCVASRQSVTFFLVSTSKDSSSGSFAYLPFLFHSRHIGLAEQNYRDKVLPGEKEVTRQDVERINSMYIFTRPSVCFSQYM